MSDQSEIQNNSPPTELFSLLGKILESTPSDTPPQASPASAEPQKSGGDIFSSLLSNPEIISKLPQIISMMKPLMEGMSSGASAPVSTAPSNTEPSKPDNSSQSTPAGLSHISHRSPDCRSTLLYAMKPYLKRDRQDAIDYIVKLSKLGDILKSL